MKPLIIYFCLFLFFVTTANKAQQWEFVGLDSMVIKHLYVSGDSIWAGSAIRNGANLNAGLYFSSDAGNNWMQIDSSLGGGSIVGMENLGNGRIYLIKGLSQYSSGGSLYKTTNNGTSWDTINISGYAICWIGVSPFNSNEIYALDISFFPSGILNYLYKSIDGGNSWEDISAFPASSHGSELAFSFDHLDSTSLYVTVDTQFDQYLFKSIDKGNNWSFISVPPIGYRSEIYTDVFLSNRIYIYALPHYLSNDGGISWVRSDSGLSITSYYLSFYQDNLLSKLYNLRTDGLYYSNNANVFWTLVNGSTNLPIYFSPTGFYEDHNMKNIFIDSKQAKLYTGTAEGIYKTSLITNIRDDTEDKLDFSLNQNYPNPFNSTTIIEYQIKNSSFVSLKVYDLLGNEITTLVNEVQQPGKYYKTFSMGNNTKSSLATGVYIYQLKAENKLLSKKMIYLK